MNEQDRLWTEEGKRTGQIGLLLRKSMPIWRRFTPGPRWEHGCDWATVQEYRDVQERLGFPVVIVVYERQTPEDATADSPLVPSDYRLTIPLDHAIEVGDHRLDWPGGKFHPERRGRDDLGGLLWARSDMNVALDAVPA